jgi:peptidyl-prolyl cis-trans isomerase D
MMVRSFEDAVFQMGLNEISNVVETDHGFHIIRLTGIKAAKPVNLTEVKGQVEQEIKKQKARKLFDEMAEGFSNAVYEQSDSLRPAAEKFHLPLQQSGWIGKSGGEPPYFNNPRLLQAVFSDDAIGNKHNTEAIEVAPNTLVSARVLDHRAASTPSQAELKDKITGIVARQESAAAAVTEGKEKLAQLKEGKSGSISWGAAQQVSRREAQGLDNETLRAVFMADAARLPAFAGLPNPKGGFTLIRISRVTEPPLPDANGRKLFARQLQQVLTEEELSSYLAGVRKRYEISVKSENLEKK